MTVSVETMKMMAAMGLSLEQAISLAEQMERDHGPAQSTGAIRQRRYRERKASQAASQCDVTRDVTERGDGSPQEYISTPLLNPQSSEATASGADPSPPTAKQILWSKGKALLVDRSGMSKAQAGDLIGKWVGQWGVEVVLAKVEAAEAEAENPKTWIAKALGREPKLAGDPNETALSDWIGARQPRLRADECLTWARRVLKPLAELPAEAIAKGVRHAIAENPRFDSEMPGLVSSKAREWVRLDARPKAAPRPAAKPAEPPSADVVTADQLAELRRTMGKTADHMRAA